MFFLTEFSESKKNKKENEQKKYIAAAVAYFFSIKKTNAKIRNKKLKKITNLKKAGKKICLNSVLTLKKISLLKIRLSPLKKASFWFILKPTIGKKAIKNSAKAEK